MTGFRQRQSFLIRLVPIVALSLAATLTPIAVSALQSEAPPPAAAEPKVPAGPKLVGPTWRLVSLNGKDLPPTVSKPPQMNLMPQDSKIAGFTGCNRFLGTYVVHEQEFRVEDGLAVTRMACHSSVELEGDFLKALQSADSWKIVDGMLELYHQKELVARFKSA